MPRLLIGAAHTLENPGEIFQDLREADLTRKILQMILPHLDNNKITYMPVPLDLPLLQRIEWINNTGYSEEQNDYFIEIHINDADGTKRGIESWYRGSPEPGNKSQKLSEEVVKSVCQKTGYFNQGTKSEYEHELGSLLILNQINLPGTAIEFLYIDNPEDIAILKDDKKLDELAKAIADSIKDFFDGKTAPAGAAQPQGTPAGAAAVAPNAVLPATTPVAAAPAVPAPQPMSPAPSPFPPSPALSFGGGRPSYAGGAASMFGGGNSAFGGAGFGGSSFGGAGGFGGGSPFGGAPGGSKTTLMDREQRKEMVKKVYEKVLGKEPNQADLNFHLNTATTEDDLTKKLVESEDFKTMVTDSKEAAELRDKVQKIEAENAALKGNLNDINAMQKSLNDLLAHKNELIAKLHQELVRHNLIKPGVYPDPANLQQNPAPTLPSSQQNQQRGIMGIGRR